MYDVAIVGAGPAGLSAALNLQLHNKSILWFGSRELSSKVQKSERIANYPAMPMVTGPELNRAFLEQIDRAGLVLTEQMVTSIMPMRTHFSLLAANEIYDAKTVLLAIGTAGGKGFAGEQELLGRGVSYCATCDGFLYKGKTVAVYCGAPRYEHEVAYLAGLADTVYLFTPYASTAPELPNVKRAEKPMAAITGDSRVAGVRLTDGTEIALDGVFVLRDAVAPAVLLAGLETDGAHIAVDRAMRTNVDGCFAAGDCTGRPYQIATAVGEGNTAAHAMLAYLAALDKEGMGEQL